ncbi:MULTISPECIES: sigma-70 family RNA polymerase sigma factor [Dictyoglomus]|jgi:RNA polymerase sigma factor (sigma-70 family)|uniref:sigma-70 family RNA polymerase sigma factor n=1 Tax=Dictyoglomus TaxID=13 RepID=UPI000CCF6FCC|nr:sigma-70 family RNA polymerase sigma factor [Dictyoglomus turgidum]PNV80940.1 MAG: sigma-70 family RNA polymerase sigma factor [Dictyoglomus turgidum]
MREEILFLAYKPLLFKYLKMLYIPEIDFEDFKQEGEIALLEVLRRYDSQKGNLSGYVKKALYYRLLRIREKLKGKDLYLEGNNVSYEAFEEESMIKFIDFSKLSKREKQIIILIFYSRHSEREVAKYLGISRSSVKIYKKRALNKLKN